MASGREKIWFISEFFYPVNISTGYYISEIARSFAARGLKVGAITTQGMYRHSGIVPLPRRENFEGIDIHRVSGSHRKSSGLLLRTIGMLKSVLQVTLAILVNVRGSDRIVAVTNPPLLIPVLYLNRLFKGTQYTIILHDLFPENLLSAKIVKSNGLTISILRSIYYHCYARAETIISIGRDMQLLMQLHLTGKKPKIVTVTNWADDVEVKPIRRSQCSIVNAQSIEDKVVLQFAGNIGKVQNIEILLKIARECRNPNILFQFIGMGDKVSLVKKYIVEESSQNVVHIDYIDRQCQNDFLNACDIGMVTLSDGMYGLGVPSKAYNILSTGKPILYVGEEGSEIFEMVRENNVGWSFRSDQVQEMVSLVESLDTLRTEIAEKGTNARRIAETIFSKESILNEYYQAVFPSIVPKRN